MPPQDDYFSLYLKYTGVGEVSPILTRWGALMTAAVLVSRRSFLPFGNGRIFPNLYVVLLGEAASRKSTAINGVERLLKTVGYDRFAPAETSKGKFAMHLAGISELTGKMAEREILARELMALELEAKGGLPKKEQPSESFICAGELANFLGLSNFDFASFLGDIWDKDGSHEISYKNAGEFKIMNPLVNLLGGNTFEGMMKTLPPEMMGQGFLSRCIFIYAPPAREKIAFPEGSLSSDNSALLGYLSYFMTCSGQIKMDESAKAVLTDIYKTWPGMPDHRFKSYAGRRFTQLLKLCMLEAICAKRTNIITADAIRANTWLSYAESQMPKALGEYGSGKNSMGSNAVMNVFYANPQKQWIAGQLWEQCSSAFDSMPGFYQALASLVAAKRLTLENAHLALARSQVISGKYINLSLFKEYIR